MESPRSLTSPSSAPSAPSEDDLRATATRLIRGVDELFPRQHVERALSKVERVEQSSIERPRLDRCDDLEEEDLELLRKPPDWRKRKLRAECGLLTKQLHEKKSSEENFLKNMMTFFKDEDGKSIALRMQIQDLVDQYEELNKHCEQQELEGEALQACLQLMAAYAEDAKQRNTFLIETLTTLLSNQPTIIPGEQNELSRAWQENVSAAHHRLCNDFDMCTDNMLCRRNMFLDRLEDAKRENKEHALQMALLMQTTTQAREKLDGFKRRYFWDSSSESLKATRIPKLPLADTADLEPPCFARKDPEHLLEDVPELSEDLSPQSSKSREKQPEQEPDCVAGPTHRQFKVQACPPSALSHDQPLQCQRHLHSLLPQAVPTQHHRMCSPPRIPVYTQSAPPQLVWQFRSPQTHGPTYIAEPRAMPKMRVSVSPPRIAPPRSAQLLGGGASSCRLPAQWCSGASVRVPSPVPEGVRAEPRWRSGGSLGPPKRGSCPVPLSENAHAWTSRAPRASHPAMRSGANGGVPSHAGRATVPTYAAPVPCQFSPRRPVRSPSPLRTPRAASPLVVRPITYHVGGRCAGAAGAVCSSRTRDSRTPSPCAQKVFRSGQPLRVAVLPSNQVPGDSVCGSCQAPSFAGMSWELPSRRSPPPRPAPRPVPVNVVLQAPLPAPPVLRMPLRSPSPVDLRHTPRGRVEPYNGPPANQIYRHFSPLSRSIQAPCRPMEPKV